MTKTIICSSCGMEVEKTGSNQIRCKSCAVKAELDRKRRDGKRKVYERKSPIVKAQPQKNNHAEIVRLAKEARERGLSYGQRVAMGGR